MRILKKAPPLWGAFLFIGLWIPNLYAACSMPSSAQRVQVAHVYDGDTVRLTDGRRIRLIGINTPETEKEGIPAEPYAKEAKSRLEGILAGADIKLLPGRQSYDRYKRNLAYLFADGALVSEMLIEEGLGHYVAIPPNTRFLGCLSDAEAIARKKGEALWSEPVRDVAALHSGESGFRLLRGRVAAVKTIKTGYILEIESQLAIKISKETSLLFDQSLEKLLGREVEVRGWIRPKSAKAPKHYLPWFMQLTHPAQLRI